MNKPMWDWMDEMEGKKKGTSSENLEKEKKRQGYGKEAPAKKKKVAGKMNKDKKSFGDTTKSDMASIRARML